MAVQSNNIKSIVTLSDSWIYEVQINAKFSMGKTGVFPCIAAASYSEGSLKKLYDPDNQCSALLKLLQTEQSLENCDLVTPIEPFSKEANFLVSLLLKKHPRAVYFGSLHPNEKEKGKIFKALRDSGILCFDLHQDVKVSELDRRFWTWACKGRSYIHLKISLTMDGMVVPTPGQKTRLAGTLSSQRIHRIRGIYDALLLGANTVRNDEAQMTYRGTEDLPQPKKIILSRSNKLDPNLPAFQGSDPLIYTEDDLLKLTEKLARKNITSILVEGGWQVYKEFIEQGVIDELSLVWTQKVGNKDSLPLVGNLPYGVLRPVGDDIWEIIKWPVTKSGRLCPHGEMYETN